MVVGSPWSLSHILKKLTLTLSGPCIVLTCESVLDLPRNTTLKNLRQTSFALGRPDSLGPDEYHTQIIPGSAASYGTDHLNSGPQMLQIIPCMVELSRTMRRVSLLLYTVPCSTQEKVFRARELDTVLSLWAQALPAHLRLVESPERGSSLKQRLKQAGSYTKKQSVVLMIRKFLRMPILQMHITDYRLRLL